jgi:CMP-N-acetylneuraminic acid synthetase
MKPLCLIPARAGSKRIPGKNLRDFCGVPALKRVIDMTKASKLFGEVVVSSEDRATLHLAEGWGATPLYCSTEYAHRDDSMLEDVLDHFLQEYADCQRVCMVLPTAVLMDDWLLQIGLRISDLIPPLPVVSYIAHGRDAGQFYWLDAKNYIRQRENGTEILDMIHAVVPVGHVVDINTEEDWVRAEEMYRRLHV